MRSSAWPSWKQLDWPTTLFLTVTPTVGVIGTGVAIWLEGFSWGMFLFGLVFAILTNLSITTGYHRLFSHRSYEAHPVMQWLLVFIGTSAWQASVLKWCTDHRVHHSEVDTDDDPYSINKGFWYAHLGWMFWKVPADYKINCPDLEKNALLRFQHKYYIPLAIAIGFLMPLFVGWYFGYPLSGLFMVGALRIGMTQQSTFFVNSLSHTLGRQTYSNQVSARDSIIVAILTHGEGYHNFHHKFQIDYRNGIRWWHWDPTKWTIQMMSWMGLAKKLRTVSQTEILKARLQMEAARLSSKGYSQEKLESLRSQIVTAQMRLKTLKEDYKRMKKQLQDNSWERLETLKLEIAQTKLEFRFALKQWQVLLKGPALVRIRN